MYKNKENINYLNINQTVDNDFNNNDFDNNDFDNNDDNENIDDVNDNYEIEEGYKEIESLENTETENKYSFKEEIKRVFNFYKEQPSIIVIVIFITYLLYYSFKNNNSNININIKNGKYIKMSGGDSEEYQSMKSSIFELFVNTNLWNNLKKEYDYNASLMNKIMV